MAAIDRLKERTAACTESQLLGSLSLLLATKESGGELTADERMVHAVLCDELEARHPELTPILEVWLDSWDDVPPVGDSYGRIILNHVIATR